MSAVRILILGILNATQSSHGYEIRQELESWNAANWANIAYGSIYFALNKMAQEGLVQAQADEDNSQPGRIVYTITPAGKNEFFKLLRQQWWQVKPLIDPFQVALTFMTELPREELIAALNYRHDYLKALIKSFEQMAPLRVQEQKAPRHIIENITLSIEHMKTEMNWIKSTLQKVEQGDLP